LSRPDAGENRVAAQDGTTQIFADETAAFQSRQRCCSPAEAAPTTFSFRFEGPFERQGRHRSPIM